MGLRFRKSFTVVPGVRLNLTSRGLSATIGPRGANLHIGAAGAYANLGIPGSGLSVRTRVDAPSRRAARDTYRSLSREMRNLERAAENAAAALAHEEHVQALDRLANVLKDRVREPFDWSRRTTQWAAPASIAFTVPSRSFTPETVRADVARERSLVPPIVLAAASPASFLFDPLVGGLVVGAVGAGCVVWAVAIRRARQAETEDRLRRYERDHQAAVEAARAAHEQTEADRKRSVEEHNALADRLRAALETRDPEVCSVILHEELTNEDVPIPLVCELEFVSGTEVQLEVALPEIDVVPAVRTRLTKAGKLSRREMSGRDRTAIYVDVCCALALRLAYETFRVLPHIERVDIFGSADGVDPATGRPTEFIALYVRTTRKQFEGLDLDALDPSTAVEHLGGQLGVARTGELRPLDGVSGLRSD